MRHAPTIGNAAVTLYCTASGLFPLFPAVVRMYGMYGRGRRSKGAGMLTELRPGVSDGN
jgi:hypothetical protein